MIQKQSGGLKRFMGKGEIGGGGNCVTSSHIAVVAMFFCTLGQQ
jgi:hypothetical protein